MPRNRNKPYVCKSCRLVFKGKAATPCPNCKSKNTERLIGGYDQSPDEPDDQAHIPDPPKAAPPVFASAGRSGGGGAITADLLRSVKLRKVVREGPVVPGPKDSPVPFGVRVLAASIRNPRVAQARFGRPWPQNGPMYYLPAKPIHDLQLVLGNIAKGMTNVAHGNYNTRYQNRAGDLPSMNNPFDRVRAQYFEYGWTTPIPQNLWKAWQTVAGAPAPDGVKNRLGGFLETDQGKMNTERLIFAATGEVFYTPDHYVTFWRYSYKLMDWFKYLSPEARYGASEPDWDASIYYE